MNLAEPVQKNSKIHILAVGLLGMIIWISNFVHAGSFGIYEDDYIMVLPAIGRSFSELLSANWGYLCGWPQGRPVFWILTHTWIWLGYHLGGINALYLGAFFLQWICAIFVFKLLLRLVSFYPAFLGTVFFALFPPDTSKQIIMHQVVFPWMTLCLLTFFFLFQRRSFVLASLLLVLMGLTYEPYLLASLGCGFLLLAHSTAKNPWRVLLPPLLVTVGVLVSVLVLRQVLGEVRAVQVLNDPWGPIARGMAALFIGPFQLLIITLGRSWQALFYSSWDERMAWATVAGLILALLFSRVSAGKESLRKSDKTSHQWLFLAGAVMTVAPYLYRFYPDYYPPTINLGRLSGLHQVSALGASLLLALLIQASLRWGKRKREWVLVAWVVWITAFVPLGLRVQTSQYVRSAILQREFWLDLVSQIGDWRTGDAILIDMNSYETNQRDWRPGTEGFPSHWIYNYSNKVPDLFVLPADWPKTWPEAPGVYAYDRKVQPWIKDGGLAMTLSYIHSQESPLVIFPGRFLYFHWEQGRLVRTQKPIVANDKEFYPKIAKGNYWMEPAYTKLGSNIFDRPPGMWHKLIKNKNYPR